jgi:alpha-tubulin suppressor-like RCC1 family protein
MLWLCAMMGTVVAWGSGGSGQTTVPGAAVDIVGIAAGNGFSAAVKSDGSVLAWGENGAGQTSVPVAASKGVVAIAAGSYHTLAIVSIPLIVQHPITQSIPTGADATFTVTATTDHPPLAYQWERNGTNIPGATSSALIIPSVQPATAANYTVVVTDTVGSTRSADAQLTLSDTVPSMVIDPVKAGVGWAILSARFNPQGAPATAYFEYGATTNYGLRTPAAASAFHNREIGVTNLLAGRTGLPAGTYHARFVAAGVNGTNASPDQQFEIMSVPDGRVLAWGNNTYGQTGVPAGAQSGVTSVAAGIYHTLALKKDGAVVGWGRNNRGQTTIPAAAKADITAIAAGGAHSVALRSDGTVIEWPPHWFTPSITGALAVAAGGFAEDGTGDFAVALLRPDGEVIAWGDAEYGAGFVPDVVSNVVSIAAGSFDGIALKGDGSVLTWNSDYLSSPVEAGGGVVAVAAGKWHFLALRHDSSVVAWGGNTYGEASVPAAAKSGVVAIAAGDHHSVALKSDGSVVAWGWNTYGQTNVPATARTGIVGIAAGLRHTVAVQALPVIVSPPTSRTAWAGTDVTFNVAVASVSPPISYQWRQNGINITGATNQSLTIPNVQTTNAGSYTVVASDRVASVTSAAAVLTVNAVVQPALSTPAWAGQQFSFVINTAAGVAYHLERKNDLSEPVWTTVLTIMGDGTMHSLIDTNATASQGFYRVRIQ